MSHPRKLLAAGFSYVELTISMTVLIPVLAVIATSVHVLNTNIAIDDARSDTTEKLRRSMQRVVQTIRPGVRSTFRVRATQDDIDWHTVNMLTPPTLGDWIEVRDLTARSEVRFQSADGEISMNAAKLTAPRRLFFVRDPADPANNSDDDGDSYVDEGTLQFEYDGQVVTLASNIEACEITLDGKLITISLASAQADGKGRTHRSAVQQSFYMRNK